MSTQTYSSADPEHTAQSLIQDGTRPCPVQQFDYAENSAQVIFSDATPGLPAVDGGHAAWRLLLAAFVFEALLWGFPLSFGVFQEYYSQLPEFEGNPFISAIGTTASGISYLGAPFITPVIRRWAPYRKQMILVGWPMCILGLVVGSFANTLGTLLITQGVMYGVGFTIFYYPILSMVDEFWIRRRGMAYGLLCSASGASGAVTPVIIQLLLRRYGYQTTLRSVAVALVVLTGPLIPLLRGRLEHHQTANLRTDWSFLRKRLFWAYSVSNVLMGLGYFFPAVFLPSYATLIGLQGSRGALLLTLMSVAQVAGQFSFGYMSDKKVPVNALISMAALVAAVVTLTMWGLARTMVPLAFFAVLYGFFGAGYTAMWARMVTTISEEASASQAMFGLFCAGKGVGNIMTSPISAALLSRSVSSSGYAHGTYQTIVIFSGVCLFLSAASLSVLYIKPKI